VPVAYLTEALQERVRNPERNLPPIIRDQRVMMHVPPVNSVDVHQRTAIINDQRDRNHDGLMADGQCLIGAVYAQTRGLELCNPSLMSSRLEPFSRKEGRILLKLDPRLAKRQRGADPKFFTPVHPFRLCHASFTRSTYSRKLAVGSSSRM
jgi:hypothetical protein